MIYAKVGEPFQQIGGECPDGFIVMQSERPDAEHIAKEDGTWIKPQITKKDLVNELTAEYQVNVDKIQKAYIIAQINNDDNLKALLSTRLNEATTEYNQKRGVIENG